MKRVKVAALLAAVAVAAVGCTAGQDVGEPRPPAGGPPMPKGAAEVSGLPAPSADTSCDPEKSLRPDGPPPAPGDFPAGSAMAAIKAQGPVESLFAQSYVEFTRHTDGRAGACRAFWSRCMDLVLRFQPSYRGLDAAERRRVYVEYRRLVETNPVALAANVRFSQ